MQIIKNKIVILLLILIFSSGYTISKLSAQNSDKIVRVVYMVPNDKKINNTYKISIEKAVLNVQQWYLQKTGNTFKLNNTIVEVIKSNHPSAWYNNTKSKFWSDNKMLWFSSNAIEDAMNLAGVKFNDSQFAWVIYVDAEGDTGTGGNGIASLPLHDILGVSGIHPTEKNVQRWYGGLAHEIGHVFGLAHPGESEPDALMQYGYTKYPDCYLTRTDLETLKNNPFLIKKTNNIAVATKKFLYEGGSFVKTDKNWKETNSGGTHYFQETGTDNNFYYLEDKTRNMKLKIPKSNGWSYFTLSDVWQKLYYITKG